MGGIVGGIVLIIIGAVLSFAIHVTTPGFNLTDIGYILMAGGLVIGIIGAVFAFRSRTVTTNRTVTDPVAGERAEQVRSSSTL